MRKQLEWMKCQGDSWCPLSRVNLSHDHFKDLEGVYIIWHGGQEPATVYVGQGNIKERLSSHRNDYRIQLYAYLGLFVTWARADNLIRDGIELFLIDSLHPKVSQVAPSAYSIGVNLPW